MNSPPRVRLVDIAKKANLSIAAVSMALRDHASLPASTVQRVKTIARKMQYAPDPALSALAAYRRRVKVRRDFNVIALVSNWHDSKEWLSRESAQKLIAGATARALTLGYVLQHFPARDSGMSPKRLRAVLQARGIRAVILAPFEHPADKFEPAWEQFTVVTIERPKHYTQFYHVGPNYFADMLLVWEKLRAKGYRRIGLVIDHDLAERVTHQWEAAHVFEQLRSNSEAVPTLVVGDTQRTTMIGKWLVGHRPDAVVSRSHGVLQAALQSGLHVGQDFGYASLNVVDDISGVSGIFQHRDAMGATAVDLIDTLMQRNHRGGNETLLGMQIDGSWCDGTTLPPAAVLRR